MATYKVIQDVEAEDKLLGPLTLRQFIYAAIAFVLLYLCYLVVSKGAAFMLVVFFPPAALAVFFAFPWGRDQPTEIWALAKVRFLFKPRRRIWDQSGVKKLVTVTAPKKIVVDYTNGLNQIQVNSRLHALASTLDTRGWAVKNVNVNLSSPTSVSVQLQDSDRLIDISSMPQAVPPIDVRPDDDMLDEHSNSVAQNFDRMINASSQSHREQIINNLRENAKLQMQVSAPAATQSTAKGTDNYWFMNQPKGSIPPGYTTFDDAIIAPGTQDDFDVPDDEALDKQLKDRHSKNDISYSHLRTISPYARAKQPVTPTPDPAILNLASRDDLNVDTIARQADENDQESGEEVVVPLH